MRVYAHLTTVCVPSLICRPSLLSATDEYPSLSLICRRKLCAVAFSYACELINTGSLYAAVTYDRASDTGSMSLRLAIATAEEIQENKKAVLSQEDRARPGLARRPQSINQSINQELPM